MIAEAERSRSSRKTAWASLQRIRALLRDKAGVHVPDAKEKSFAAESETIERELAAYLTGSQHAFRVLYQAATDFQKAAFWRTRAATFRQRIKSF